MYLFIQSVFRPINLVYLRVVCNFYDKYTGVWPRTPVCVLGLLFGLQSKFRFLNIVEEISDNVFYPPPPKLQRGGGGGNKTEGSNTIMSTSFALKFWFNKIIDVDIILSITLTVS